RLLSRRRLRFAARRRARHAPPAARSRAELIHNRPRCAMADRDAILFELGLTPTWRLRVASRPVPSDGEDAAVAEHGPSDENVPDRVDSCDSAVDARAARIATLEWRDFAADVDACTACSLAKSRRRSVPGVGDIHAEWLFVGEAPGGEEDARGE